MIMRRRYRCAAPGDVKDPFKSHSISFKGLKTLEPPMATVKSMPGRGSRHHSASLETYLREQIGQQWRELSGAMLLSNAVGAFRSHQTDLKSGNSVAPPIMSGCHRRPRREFAPA
jgi:hypothetical protein